MDIAVRIPIAANSTVVGGLCGFVVEKYFLYGDGRVDRDLAYRSLHGLTRRSERLALGWNIESLLSRGGGTARSDRVWGCTGRGARSDTVSAEF